MLCYPISKVEQTLSLLLIQTEIIESGMSFEDLQSGVIFNATSRNSDDLSKAIVAGVFQINTAVASFARLLNSLGTPRDTIQLRHKLHKSRLHIGQLVKQTSEKLKQATDIDRHRDVGAAKKIADAKLAKDFQSVLIHFQKAQRLAANNETAYAPLVLGEVPPTQKRTGGELDAGSFKSPEHVSLLVESKRKEVIIMEDEISLNKATIEERDQGIREIHHQIGEVNQIFKDLAVLVHEQGIMMGDISSNIQKTHSATTQATFHLTEASKTQKSISSMSCLMLVIFGIILLIVVIVVVS